MIDTNRVQRTSRRAVSHRGVTVRIDSYVSFYATFRTAELPSHAAHEVRIAAAATLSAPLCCPLGRARVESGRGTLSVASKVASTSDAPGPRAGPSQRTPSA